MTAFLSNGVTNMDIGNYGGKDRKSDTITNALLLQSNSSASHNEADNGRAEVEARLLSPSLTASFLRSRYEQMESTS